VAGTSGTAALSYQSGTDSADGLAGYVRNTWSVATTVASGGINMLQTGLSASTQYTLSLYVRASKVITVRIAAQFQNSSSTNVGSSNNATAVALAANTWTRLNITATSGAAVDRVVLRAEATSGLWANGDKLEVDCVLIETGATLNNYYDGSYNDTLGFVYSWTGTANASTSTAALYTPVLTLAALTNDPTDRVEVTITDLAPTTHTVTVWRTSDGKRRALRGYRGVEIVGSDFVVDYEPPLNQLLAYELEVLTGVGTGGPSAQATITLTPATVHGWIQDPLDPQSAIKVYAVAGPAGEPTLLPSAVATLDYLANVSTMEIMGSNEPVALLGQRMVAGNVPFHFFTDAAQQSTDLRNLLTQASILLIRPGADWGNSLPGACYVAPPNPQEAPVGIIWGNAYTEWKFAASLVRAPSMNVVIPFWTYQDWQDLWTTYQQAQTALSGKTYLNVKKSPATGV
jgi:hypothetical protein